MRACRNVVHSVQVTKKDSTDAEGNYRRHVYDC